MYDIIGHGPAPGITRNLIKITEDTPPLKDVKAFKEKEREKLERQTNENLCVFDKWLEGIED